MATINDGGLAFPGTRSQQVGTTADYGMPGIPQPTFADVTHGGMTLRDWFAGQMLISMADWTPRPQVENLMCDEACRSRARLAYMQADAMIAAREVKP